MAEFPLDGPQVLPFTPLAGTVHMDQRMKEKKVPLDAETVPKKALLVSSDIHAKRVIRQL